MGGINFITREKFDKGKVKLRTVSELNPESANEAATLGITFAMGQEFVSADPKEKIAEIRFPIREWQLNPNKTFHGGMIATAFDNAFGAVVIYSYDNSTATTVGLNVNYLKPIRIGENLLIRVKAVSFGKRLATVTGEGYAEESGELTCTASAVYRVLPDSISL